MTSIDIANYVRHLKIDLETLLSKHATAKMRFFTSAPDADFPESFKPWFPEGKAPPVLPLGADSSAWKARYEDISVAVDCIRSSYLAPALQLNNYLEWTATDIEWDEIKYDLEERDLRPSGMLRRVSSEAYAAATLLAIKSGLDRLVRILSFYYPGIAAHTTWGRYEDGQPGSGFMAVVKKNMSTDRLLTTLDAAYIRWIKLAVAPRDALMHYEDATTTWHLMPEENALVPIHFVGDVKNQLHKYGVGVLSTYVNEWYKLIDETLLSLAVQLPKTPRAAL